MLSFLDYVLIVERKIEPSREQEKALSAKHIEPHYKLDNVKKPSEIPGGTVKKNLFKPDRSFGIDRSEMPQVENNDFLRWLISLGIGVERVQVKPSSLVSDQRTHFAQTFMYLDKSNKKIVNRKVLKDLIIISKDDVVFDGNHRWLSLMRVAPDIRMPMFKVNMNFDDLYRLTKSGYPKVKFSK